MQFYRVHDGSKHRYFNARHNAVQFAKDMKADQNVDVELITTRPMTKTLVLDVLNGNAGDFVTGSLVVFIVPGQAPLLSAATATKS